MSHNPHDFDVIILGGGLVGATLALVLRQQQKRVLLIEKKWPQTDLSLLAQNWDARIYALNPANQALLAALGVWSPERAQAVTRMDVRGDQGGRIEFNAADLGVPCLNHMIENRYLLAGLWHAMLKAGVVIRESQASALTTTTQAAVLTLADGDRLSAALVVGADGAHSWLRQQLGIKVNASSYQQQGLVANFKTQKPHHGCAYQWFDQGDILAYLPLPEQQISIVWSTARATELQALPAEALASAVARQGDYALGELTLNTPVFAFDLVLRQPESIIAQRALLVGDAAHTVHPLAGQGVNLGLADVQYLGRLLANQPDVGSWALLKQYQRGRLFNVRAMQRGCDGLFKLFAREQIPAIPWLRNQGLNLVNHLTPVKNALMRQAMGL
ncbi:FAD-dependent monooxygenase [Neisseriaceae bacterium ESL0693]|nr:FAD-dependent monooxygenase [Neisseriaceae bacterium ESL0693]